MYPPLKMPDINPTNSPFFNIAGTKKPASGFFCFLMLLLFSTVFSQAGNSYAGQASLSWAAPVTNSDGTALTDLVGYKVYYGTASGNYTQDVGVENVTNYTVSNLTGGTYYFAITAYDISGNQSAYSNELSKTIPPQSTLTVTDSGTGSGMVTSSPSGISCGATCSGMYNSGTVVTLAATAAANSAFAGWSGGGCAGTGLCSFSLNADTTVTAVFNVLPTVVTLTMDKPSPQETGAVVTFTAAASGGSGSYQYYFIVFNPNTGTWSVGQAYSSNASWTWDTTGLGTGTYSIQVWAKSVGSTAAYEAYKSISYTLITPPPPVTAVTLSMNQQSPQQTGAKITFIAAASGGSGSYQYYFTFRNPNTGVWSVGQAYSSNASWTWDTTGLGTGTYSIQVWAKSVGSTAAYEAYKSISYTLITPPPPVTAVTLSMNQQSPQQTGAKITFIAAASGGSGSYQYYFTFRNPNTGVWSVGQAYSSNASWTWDTTGLGTGTYSIQVWAKSVGSTAAYEAYKSISYTLITPPPPVTAVTLSMNQQSPQQTGAKITFTAAASGGSGSYQYYFIVFNPNTGTWSVGQAYSSNASWTWDTTGLGTGAYSIQVWARSVGSTANYEAWTGVRFTLNSP